MVMSSSICYCGPRWQTAPVIRRGPGRGEDDVDRRGRASRRIGRDIRTEAGRGPPAGQAVTSYPVRVTGADIEIEV